MNLASLPSCRDTLGDMRVPVRTTQLLSTPTARPPGLATGSCSNSDGSSDSDGGNDDDDNYEDDDGSSSDTDRSEKRAIDRLPSASSPESGHPDDPVDENTEEKPARSHKRQKVTNDRARTTLPRLNSMPRSAGRLSRSPEPPQAATTGRPQPV
ncbi:hypothetical protein PWT90_07762 [Aphanocladium album]|nr:hypothetical protein PWT90_07762 [Aphanocladium album]